MQLYLLITCMVDVNNLQRCLRISEERPAFKPRESLSPHREHVPRTCKYKEEATLPDLARTSAAG